MTQGKMFKALYSFKKTHPTSLSFNAGDVFIGLPGAGADKNWYYVLDTKGLKGFVPRNYVQDLESLPTYQEFNVLLDDIRQNVIASKVPDKERGDTLAKIELLRTDYCPIPKPKPKAEDATDSKKDNKLSTVPEAPAAETARASSPRQRQLSEERASTSRRDSTPPKSSKKRAAPKPPVQSAEASEPSTSSTISTQEEAAAVIEKSKPVVNASAPQPQEQAVADKVQVKAVEKAQPKAAEKAQPKAAEKCKPLASVSQHVNAIVNVVKNSKESSKEPANGQVASVKQEQSSQPINNGQSRRSSTKSYGRRASLARGNSLADPTPDQIKTEARELVDVVRELTGMSHMASQTTVRTVLQYVQANLGKLDRNIPTLISALERPVMADAEAVATSPDSKALEALFQKLVATKDDNQQRNWMLHEDEAVIEGMLRRLMDFLHTCDHRISKYCMRRHKYEYVLSLVEYYQMETRRNLRLLLLEAFLQMCTLDPRSVIDLMLNSVLPLELAQDLYAYSNSDVERCRLAALLLTVIFSRGEPMPVQYADHGQLGRNFVDFVLECIEKPVLKREQDMSDIYIGLVLSYNLQFTSLDGNIFIERLSLMGTGAKTYTEKILLLLNREDDPAAVIGRDHIYFDEDGGEEGEDFVAKSLPNSVQKVILDMFQHRHCRDIFYTNDMYVLIDIIVRQLCDLTPEDPRRMPYVVMCQLVLKNTNYDEHLHRFKDLQERFMRILEGEENTKEKEIISSICKDIPAFNSLVQTGDF